MFLLSLLGWFKRVIENGVMEREVVVKVKRESFVVALCSQACPVGVDVPRYIRCIKEGKFDEALAVNREKLPLPVVCADVCLAYCEDACAYQQFGDPVAIRALKRAAVDKGGDYWKRNKKPAVKTGKRIAIVGAGPAGLTAAYYLVSLGHDVVVYDSLPKPGGTLRYGVPKYRLSEERLDRDINEILELGVKFRPNTVIGEDISWEELKKDSDAIFLTPGVNKSVKINIEGSDKPGVLWGWEFLRDISLGKRFIFEGDVIVVGGGDVAIDVALTARRLGASKVSLACLEREEEMPAHGWELARAREEGVVIHASCGPRKIKGNETVEGVEFVRCTSVFDEAGNFNPQYDEKITRTLEAQYVVLAIGQTAAPGFLQGQNHIEVVHGTIKVDSETLATGESGIFAGGDVVSGSASVIEAIAQGRKAAISIDKYLGGEGVIDEKLATPEEEVILPEFTMEVKPPVQMPQLDPKERLSSFEQIEQGFNQEQAIEEARRCLACDARRFTVVVYPENCKECGYCQEVCGLDIFASANLFNSRGYRPVVSTNSEKCVGCLQCFFSCPDYAIDIREITGLKRGDN